MSSITTVRRVKERGGSGGKVTALKPSTPRTLTPVTEKDKCVGSNRKPVGKENVRSISATRSSTASQKSVIKPVPIPRIDKSAIRDGESRGGVRWSSSSVPRGRSSSPSSDFARLLSDRMSRVSISDRSGKIPERGGKFGNEVKGLERSQSQKANSVSKSKFVEGIGNGYVGLGDSKRKVNIFRDKNVDKDTDRCRMSDSNVKLVEKQLNGFRGLGKEVDSNRNVAKLVETKVNNAIQCLKDRVRLDVNAKARAEKATLGGNTTEGCKQKSYSDLDSKVAVSIREAAHGGASSLDTSLKGLKGNTLNNMKVLENSKEKVDSEEVKPVRASNKYSSKLHEKLAFLEGKVKRIASDIKKTKEMLDKNNPDTSKTIITDIQEKISGIEKAMGHTINDNQGSLDAPKIVKISDQQSNCLETSQSNQVRQSKNSVKDLNREELEARLFPHHKLLKGRTNLNASSESSQNDRPPHSDSSADSELEDMVLSPIEQNSIASEFLESINKKTSKCSTQKQDSLEFHEIQEMDGLAAKAGKGNLNVLTARNSTGEIRLTSDEALEDFDDEQENKPEMVIEEMENSCMDQLNEIGWKTSTGGWFVSEGESVLLAHDDGSCTFYDIANCEVKAEYKPPALVTPNLLGDCWLIRATDSDGCSGRYVVAASSGSTLDSGFCSWDFYTKEIRAFHAESEAVTSSFRTVLGPLPNRAVQKRNLLSTMMSSENQQWWYKPCGHLLASTASSQRVVSVYDIRDGEQVMKWDIQRPVITMDYSSPLHWRNRGKVVIAEAEAISLWDVNSLTPQALLSVASSGRKVSALHVNNTDAELGGGVRKRVSSSEVEGHDGAFCTQDTINVMDFRLPSGVGLKISKIGVSVQSVFSHGDSIFVGCTNGRLVAKEQAQSCVQQFSLRKGRLVSTYALPESNAHFHCSSISQVWGNSDIVMGICGLGLFVFDASKDEATPTIAVDNGKSYEARDVIGPADLYSPSFDYLASRVLVISRDRPAMWRYLS